MEVQSDITFDTKLQIGPFFLQNTPHDQYISNEPLPCMREACMLTIPFMFILEGNFIIQIWFKIQAKYHFHHVYWLVLSEDEVCMGTVHVLHGHDITFCMFCISLHISLILINQGLIGLAA
jgi:hypothetical protein